LSGISTAEWAELLGVGGLSAKRCRGTSSTASNEEIARNPHAAGPLRGPGSLWVPRLLLIRWGNDRLCRGGSQEFDIFGLHSVIGFEEDVHEQEHVNVYVDENRDR
jgi:hypothetical protein